MYGQHGVLPAYVAFALGGVPEQILQGRRVRVQPSQFREQDSGFDRQIVI